MEGQKNKIKKLSTKRTSIVVGIILVLVVVIIGTGLIRNKLSSDSEIQLISTQKNFQLNDKPKFEFIYKNKGNTFDKLTVNILNLFRKTNEYLSVGAKVFAANGEEVNNFNPKVEYQRNGKFSLDIDNSHIQQGLKPGKYKIELEIREGSKFYIQDQDFAWGVLAINTNKSIYLPGEKAYLQMAVLNDYGHTICDANVKLEITSPSGEISNPKVQKGDDCGPDNVTNNPDYFAYYQTTKVGVYQMKLKNLDNDYEITDFFEVRESVPFEVERVSATRINPSRANYTMTIIVKANHDFDGKIQEQVPENFQIARQEGMESEKREDSTEISWKLKIKTEEEIILQYEYDAPDISPQLYLLGPLRLIEGEGVVFEETRKWQIAADATKTAVASGNWNTGSTWSGGTVPASGDDVVINGGYTVTINAALANNPYGSLIIGGEAAGTLNIYPGATGSYTFTITNDVTVNSNGSFTTTNRTGTNYHTLNIGGNLTIDGTFNMITSTDDHVTVVFNGSSQQTISGSGLDANCTFWGITDSNTSTNGLVLERNVTLAAAGTQTNTPLTVSANDVLDLGSYTADRSGTGSGTVTVNAGATLKIGGTGDFPANYSTNTLNATSMVQYYGTDQSVTALTYGNLDIAGSGTKTSGGAITVATNLTIGDGVTFSHGAYNLTITGTTTVGGGTSGNLTISSTSGTKQFTGLVTISSGATWDNSINSAVNFRGGITNNGTFTCGTGNQTFTTNAQALNGTLSIPNATVTTITLTNNGTLTVGTALGGTGGLTNAATGTLNIGGTSGITTLTATAVGNTVNYTNATGGQTVIGTTYFTLTLSNTSGTDTASNNITATTLNISNASAILDMSTYTLSVTTPNNSGTIETQNTSGTPITSGKTWGGTVNYNSTAGGQTVVAGTYNNLTIDKTGQTGTLGGNIILNGNLTISNGELDTDVSHSYSIDVAGNWSNSGTFTANSGTVTLDGSALQTLSGTMTGSSSFYDLVITNTYGSVSGCSTSFSPGIKFDTDATSTGTYTINATSGNIYLEYKSGSTYTFNNIVWEGTASYTIYFRNSNLTSGTWLLKVTGNQNGGVSYVNVARSDASVSGGSEIDADDSTNTDCGNNTNWLFIPGIQISGTVWTNEAKSTNIGANKTVHLFVNSSDKNTQETNGSGQFTFSNITVAANDSVIVYLDGETEDGSTMTLAVDSTTAISNLDIITAHISLEHRAAGPITNTDLDDIDGVDAENEDGVTISGGNATFASGFEVYILDSMTYTPGGTVSAENFQIPGTGTFRPNGNAVSISGTLQMDGGLINATSSNLSLTANTITMNAGSITTTTSGNITIYSTSSPGAFTLNTVTSVGTINIGSASANTTPSSVTNNGVVSSGGNINIYSNSDFTQGADITANSGASNVYFYPDADNIGSAATFTKSSGTVTASSTNFYFPSSATTVFTLTGITASNILNVGTSSSNAPASVNITGAVSSGGNIGIRSNGDITQNANITANSGASNVYFYPDADNIGSAATFTRSSGTVTATYTNFYFPSSATTVFTLAGINTSNDFSVSTSSSTSPASVNITGAVSSGGNIGIRSNGDITQNANITANSGASNAQFFPNDDNIGTATFTRSSGIVTASITYINFTASSTTVFTLAGITASNILNVGNPNAPLTLNITAALTSGSTMTLRSLRDINQGASLSANSGSSACTLYPNLAVSTYKTYINENSTITCSTYTVNGDLAINSTKILTANGSAMAVTGSFDNQGTLQLSGIENLGSLTKDTNSGLVEYIGTNNTLNYGYNYYSVKFNNGTTTWTLGSALDANADLTISAGTLDQGANNNLTVNGNFTIAASGATFTKGTGTSTLILAGSVSNATFTGSATPQNLGKVQIGTSPGDVYLASDFAADSLTVDAGDTFYTKGYEVDIGSGGISLITGSPGGKIDTTDNGGGGYEGDGTTITDAGAFTINSGALFIKCVQASRRSLVKMDGGGAVDFTSNSQDIGDFQISTASTNITLQDAFDADTVTIDGSTTLTANNQSITCAGNWSNSGTFTAGSGTVTLDGSSLQTLSGTLTGSSAFYNLTITNTSGSISGCSDSFSPGIKFDADATSTGTYTINTSALSAGVYVEYKSGSTYIFNNISWEGTNIKIIYFRNSNLSGGTWLLKVTGSQGDGVSYVDVARSDASVSGGSEIDADDGTNTDCGNNNNWSFTGVPLSPCSGAMCSLNYSILASSINVGGLDSQSSASYRMRETIGEIATGESQSSSYKLKAGYRRMTEEELAVSISISSPADVTMSSDIPGVTGNLGSPRTGSATWTVTTNNAAGFTLQLKSNDEPSMKLDVTYNFSDYTPAAPGTPDYNWASPAASDAEFGFTVEPETAADTVQLFLNAAGPAAPCNSAGGINTADKCWYNMASANLEVIDRGTATDGGGEDEVVKFQTESNAKFLLEGNYTATIIATATTN
jgi:hypothetical protein